MPQSYRQVQDVTARLREFEDKVTPETGAFGGRPLTGAEKKEYRQ